MIRIFISLLFFILLNLFGQAQSSQLRKIVDFASGTTGWFEGFQQNVGKNEFEYHSFRNDVSKSLITRCKDGKMPISWQTTTVPNNWNQKNAGFLWIAALDLTSNKHVFDVSVNGQKRFEIISSNQKDWTIETADGGKLSFMTIETDQNNDAHGYMSLIAPTSWLKKGMPQTIEISGRAFDDYTWIIVYQATDALSFLQNSVQYDTWMSLSMQEKGDIFSAQISAPVTLAGQNLHYFYGNKKGTVTLQQSDDQAIGTFSLPVSAKNKSFKLNDSKGEVFVIKSLGEPFKTTRLLSKSVLLNESKTENGTIILTAQRNYKPNTVSELLKLSNSTLAHGQIYLMNSSHQDIAWMDSPEKCIIERDTMLLSPLFEMAEKDKNYRFDVEDALMIKEFIERHPNKKELVKQMLQDGRISCGSTYTQPYEEMYSGEALARQFYFGAKWLKDEFNYNPTVYWNEDVPGRTPQMMQLMRKAGTQYMMISRHERGLFNWYSPDDSFVTVFTPGHYSNAFTPLQKNFHEAAQFLASSSLDWANYYTKKTISPVIPLLSDWDMSPAKDYSQLIQQWENINELQNDQGKYVPAKLPGFKIASTPEFFDALMDQNPQLPAIRGERPNVWMYIHGPSHQKALNASREGDILLTIAEKLATANALVDGSFVNYPTHELNRAWEAKIYPDHGWGGKQGEITDALFLQKYEFAKAEAEKIINKNLQELASKVKTDSSKGRPLVVFNSMNMLRTDPVVASVQFSEGQTFGVKMCEQNGSPLNVQLTNCTTFPDGSVQSAKIHFTASEIPAIGYKTYYLQTVPVQTKKTTPEFTPQAENRFYKLSFGNGGLASIFDKELNKELVNADKFVAGEVFTMRSEGNGAGEFTDVQQPDMAGFDKTGNYPTHWQIESDGPIFTIYSYRQAIRHAVVEQHIKVYHQQKRIDFDVDLLNWEGILYREFRMALPLNMTDGQVAYEVPFGVVEVGKDEIEGAAGERYTTICKNIHPRGIENWIGASNSEFGVTLSSSVVVADWIDPTDQPIGNQILQPILLASRRSCHWEGNEYLQTGTHHFHFSLNSHLPGWEYGQNAGRQANEQLLTVWTDHAYRTASLPETGSFFSSTGENILISTVKKAENSDEVVMRLVETSGRNQSVQVKIFNHIKEAQLTNLIEEELKGLTVKNNAVEIEIQHHAIETLKLKQAD